MKKQWMKPKATGEMFIANEYVAACGDSGVIYNFKCDAPKGTLYYYPTGDGTIDGVYNGTRNAVKLGSYNPCDEKHEADSTNPFYDGFVDRKHFCEDEPGWDKWVDKNGRPCSHERVIVWRGPRNDNGHATANLDMSTWETDKS